MGLSESFPNFNAGANPSNGISPYRRRNSAQALPVKQVTVVKKVEPERHVEVPQAVQKTSTPNEAILVSELPKQVHALSEEEKREPCSGSEVELSGALQARLDRIKADFFNEKKVTYKEPVAADSGPTG